MGLPLAVAPRPSVEAMLTMRPSPRRRSDGRQARIMRSCAVRFTANVAAHTAS